MASFSLPDYRIGEQLPKGSTPDEAADADRVERLINAFIGKKQETLFTDQDPLGKVFDGDAKRFDAYK